VKVPYFRSYVFVRFEKGRRLEVLQTPGVVGFVFWLHKPALIREKEMQVVMDFFQDNAQKSIVCESFEPGQNLLIKDGPLKENKGVVLRQGKNKVVLQIQQLGVALTAEVPKNAVTAIKD
jgi:transcription antitermination factor NusG